VAHRKFSSKLTEVVAVVCAMLLVPGDAVLLAQDQPPPPQGPPPTQAPAPTEAPLPPNALDSLVAPIALYPDPLLSQIMVASTYPLELVEAAQWLQRNGALTGPALTQAAAQQNWDPSVQALVVFPDLMRRLTQDITWTTNLVNAFLAQQGDVMDAVQRMRASAQQAGKLASTPQQKVISQNQNGQPIIEIEPADPQASFTVTDLTPPASEMCTGAAVSGPTIRSTGRACPIRTGRFRSSTGLPRERTSGRSGALAVRAPDPRRASESATGRWSLPAITAARSAARRAAPRQERIAIMDFPAWADRAAVAALAVVSAEAAGLAAVAPVAVAGGNWRIR
jgi:hypothetical protein